MCPNGEPQTYQSSNNRLFSIVPVLANGKTGWVWEGPPDERGWRDAMDIYNPDNILASAELAMNQVESFIRGETQSDVLVVDA